MSINSISGVTGVGVSPQDVSTPSSQLQAAPAGSKQTPAVTSSTAATGLGEQLSPNMLAVLISQQGPLYGSSFASV